MSLDQLGQTFKRGHCAGTGKPSGRREPIDNTEHNTLALSPNTRSHSFYIVGSISGIASPDWTVRCFYVSFFLCSFTKNNVGVADRRRAI